MKEIKQKIQELINLNKSVIARYTAEKAICNKMDFRSEMHSISSKLNLLEQQNERLEEMLK